MRSIKECNRQARLRKVRNRRNREEVEELAQSPSSIISEVGSVYEIVKPSTTFLGRTDSDLDTLIQRKILRFFKPGAVVRRRKAKVMDVWETLYEEHMTAKTDLLLTRAELKETEEELMFGAKIKKIFRRFMHYQQGSTILTTTEFYLCMLLYEFNMSQLVSFGHAFNMGGLGSTVIIYLLISFFIQMPFNMWIISMVSYSKKLALGLFSDCVPLVSAIRYPVFLAFVIAESRRLLNLEAMVKFMYFNVAYDTPWSNCSTSGVAAKGTLAEGVVCVPAGTLTPHNQNCTGFRDRDSNYEYFSTQFYVQYEIFRIGNIGENYDKRYWGDSTYRFYGPILGLLSLLIARSGMATLKKFTIKVQIFVIVLASICVFSVLVERIGAVEYQWNYINVNVHFMVNFISLSLQTNSLPILMWFASMKPPHLNPATCSVIHQVIKSLVLMIMCSTYGVLAFNIAERYKMVNTDCFSLETNDIVFAMVPDFFSTFRFSKIWLMTWLLCMVFITLIYSVYMILAASESLIQVIPSGENYATLFTFLVTFAVIAFRFVNELPYVYQTLLAFELRGLNYINNFNFGALVLCIYFLYTPIRLAHEYEFVWGKQPARFWIISWHFMVAIAFMVLIMDVVVLCDGFSKAPLQRVVAAIFIVCACWLLVFHCIYLSCKGIKKKRLHNLCYPTKKWRPPTREQYIALHDLEKTKRQEIRFYCRHKCFVNSSRFNEVMEYQLTLRDKLERMQRTAIYFWYIRETVLKEETVQFFNSSIIDD